MIDDTAMNWFRLRDRRATLLNRSKLSETAARQQTFAAAMAQFEEQMTAAKIVSPATRPLNLYYGLAQAGMAIAAAHASDPWSFSSHGLKLVDPRIDLADMQVRTEGNGAFQKVAAATGSASIMTPVSLGALWASLPDLAESAVLPGRARPVPLILGLDAFNTDARQAKLYFAGEMPEDQNEWLKRFGEILADYPGTDDWKIPAQANSIRPPENEGGRWEVTVHWPGPGPNPFGSVPKAEIEAFFDRIAPEYRYRDDRFLRPSVEGSRKEPPSPLMSWWLLLFSFSILARYHPRRWMRLLNLDKPGCAVSLQYALEAALSALPHLVLEALDKEPLLLSKPISF